MGSFAIVQAVPETPSGISVPHAVNRPRDHFTGSWEVSTFIARWLVLGTQLVANIEASLERVWQVMSFESYGCAMGFVIN